MIYVIHYTVYYIYFFIVGPIVNILTYSLSYNQFSTIIFILICSYFFSSPFKTLTFHNDKC